MKFDQGIEKKYLRSIEDAFQTILKKGDAEQRRIARLILDSEMLVCVHPVSEVCASGITGVIDAEKTNERIASKRIGLSEAFGEIFITMAKETIDNGGQRGCEGTLVHEGRHAFDFAQTIESLSNADVNPLSIFDPTLYELEWEAHKTAGNYMMQVNQPEYLQEGLDLMILAQKDGFHALCEEGIKRRLCDSYKLIENEKQGQTVSEMFGLTVR